MDEHTLEELQAIIDKVVANQAALIKGHEEIVERINTLTKLVDQAIPKGGSDGS